MNIEEQKRLFSWKSFKLVIPELYIFNLTSSQNSVELSIKSKEPDGLKEIYYTWSWPEWNKFFEELEKFDQGIARIRDFKDKVAVYNLYNDCRNYEGGYRNEKAKDPGGFDQGRSR